MKRTPLKKKPPKERECNLDGCEVRFTPHPRNPFQRFCSPAHERTAKPQKPRKSIPVKSEKRKKEDAIYSVRRKAFLAMPENSICFIDGCGKAATTIEHTKGRVGSLYLDERYWRGCCLEHNLELENNPELSHKYQKSRLHNGNKGDNKG